LKQQWSDKIACRLIIR